MKGRILVVDDEPAILEVVRLNLEADGFEVLTAEDTAHALAVLDGDGGSPGIVLAILDIMLPDGDGVDLARRIRDRSDIPVMMLSARDSDIDKAVSLGVGADDYMTKPFSPVELVARVKAHLRRYGSGNHREPSSGVAPTDAIEAGPVVMDLGGRTATVRGVPVDLTGTEFEILRMLAEHPGRVYTKGQIYERVWNEDAVGDLGTVQVHVHRLRTKIERHPDEPELITTVWGIGYRFEAGAV